MNILVPIILHIAIQNVFEWAYGTFCSCCCRLILCRVNFFSFSAAKLLEFSSKFCPRIYPISFGLLFLVINFENVLTVPSSLLSSFLLHLRFCQTSLDEPLNTLHHYCLLPMYQHMLDPYTNFIFESRKGSHSFKITCCLCEPSIWRLWM